MDPFLCALNSLAILRSIYQLSYVTDRKDTLILFINSKGSFSGNIFLDNKPIAFKTLPFPTIYHCLFTQFSDGWVFFLLMKICYLFTGFT